MKIESSAHHEREVANDLLALRAIYTRVSLAFPTLDLAQLLMLSGVVEQAKTTSMLKVEKTDKTKVGRPWNSSTVVEERNVRGPIIVRQGKEEAPVLDAVEMILKKKGPLTTPDILKAFADNGWVVQTMQKNVVGAVRGAIANASDRFTRSGEGKKTRFHIKNTKPKTTASDPNRPQFLGAIVTVITEARLSTKPVNADKILELLTARGWDPKNSANPEKYIRTVLAKNGDVFKRVDRGLYVLKMKAQTKVLVHKPAKQPQVEHLNGSNGVQPS
jgi:hypothetical protein